MEATLLLADQSSGDDMDDLVYRKGKALACLPSLWSFNFIDHSGLDCLSGLSQFIFDIIIGDMM